MKIVIISAREIIICVGGDCSNSKACLKSAKTIIILVKNVAISKSDGARTITKITAIFIVFTNCIGWSTARTERFIIGNGSSHK